MSEVAMNPYPLETEGSAQVETPKEKTLEMSIEELLSRLHLGKAQFFIWTLLFLTSMMFNMVFFMTTILIPYLKCAWGLNSIFETAIGSACAVCGAISGAIFGNLADKYGRKTIPLVTALFSLLGYILAACSPNEWLFLLARIIQGTCQGIGFPITFVFASEVVSSKFKEVLVAIFVVYIGAQLGGLYISLMACFFLNEIGWRYLIAMASAPLILAILGLIFVPETPRFLLVSCKKKEALRVISKLFTWNGRSFPETCAGLTACKLEEGGQFSGLFRHGLAKLTILLCTVVFANFYVFLAFAAYLPLALEKEAGNAKQLQRENECDDNLDQSGLIEIMIAFSGDSLGAFVAAIIGGTYGDLGHRLVFRGLAFVALFATIPVFFDLSKLLTGVISNKYSAPLFYLRFGVFLLVVFHYRLPDCAQRNSFVLSICHWEQW